MKNRKEKRRGEGLESPGSSAQPAPARARPSLRPSNARALPAFARCRCRWTPRVSRTTPTPARLPASACSRCRWTPHVSRMTPTPARLPAPACSRCHWTPQVSPTILLLHAVHDHRAIEPRQQWQGGPGGHAWGMALPPLLLRAHATTHGRRMGCTPPIPLNLQPPNTGLHGRARL